MSKQEEVVPPNQGDLIGREAAIRVAEEMANDWNSDDRYGRWFVAAVNIVTAIRALPSFSPPAPASPATVPNLSTSTVAHPALMKFGSHLHGCDIHNKPRPPAAINKCDCGFADALKLSSISEQAQRAAEKICAGTPGAGLAPEFHKGVVAEVAAIIEESFTGKGEKEHES